MNLKDLVIQFCKETNIPLRTEGNVLDIYDVFIEAKNKGIISEESFEIFIDAMESK